MVKEEDKNTPSQPAAADLVPANTNQIQVAPCSEPTPPDPSKEVFQNKANLFHPGADNETSNPDSTAEIDITTLKVNYRYLISLTVCMSLSTANFGFACVTANQAMAAL